MWKFHQYLYNKQKITWPLGDTNFILSILSALEDKIHIPARPCNILYVCDLCDATQRDTFFNVLLNTKSAIGKHFHEALGRSDLLNESHFKIMRKCQGKFDFLVFEMLYFKKFKPNLNVQTDSIRARLQCLTCKLFSSLIVHLIIYRT